MQVYLCKVQKFCQYTVGRVYVLCINLLAPNFQTWELLQAIQVFVTSINTCGIFRVLINFLYLLIFVELSLHWPVNNMLLPHTLPGRCGRLSAGLVVLLLPSHVGILASQSCSIFLGSKSRLGTPASRQCHRWTHGIHHWQKSLPRTDQSGH